MADKKILTHNGYDLALMVLKEKAVPSRTVQIANLPESDASCPTGKSLILSGWGKDKTRPYRSSRYLWAVKPECLNMTECPRHDSRWKGTMICVGDKEEGFNSACSGDSGGSAD